MNKDLGAEKGLYFFVRHGGFTVHLPKGKSMLPSAAVALFILERYK